MPNTTTIWSIIVILFASLRLILSASVNVTIDDQFGDPITGNRVSYNPEHAWSLGPGCRSCTTHPDPTRVLHGTWHEGIFDPNTGNSSPLGTPVEASVTFHGSAVYVYCVLSLPHRHPTGNSEMVFLVDSEQVGSFVHSAPGGTQLVYDFLVYANTTLPLGNHTLTIQNGRKDGNPSLTILDYIIYSTDDKTLKSTSGAGNSPSTKTKALIGALTAGCILFIAALAYLIYRVFAARRKERSSDAEAPSISPVSKGKGVRIWLAGGLDFIKQKRNTSFYPALLIGHRTRPRPTSGVPVEPQNQDIQRLSQVLLIPEELTSEGRAPAESRWASIMLWRDRASNEAEIPSLPPTNNAPSTTYSGHVVPQLQAQNHQAASRTPRQKPPRKFTVMNM